MAAKLANVLKSYLLKTPPRSEAFRHSGGDSLLWISATVTLYLDVELSRLSRPGTEQKTSLGLAPPVTESKQSKEWRFTQKNYISWKTGVGDGSVVGATTPPKVLIWWKSGQNHLKSEFFSEICVKILRTPKMPAPTPISWKVASRVMAFQMTGKYWVIW